MEPYRVNLDVYNGPLDLLLYLIRRDEVDIYDIPIARVTEQYCRYVEMIQQVDPNLAGEFLVLAATLLEIKSRMLLPTPPPEEATGEEGLGDPRSELVRQLLQYKAFKDAAAELRQSAEQQAQRFPRPGLKLDLDETELELENVQVWHLLEAFNKIMSAIGRNTAAHEVIYDDTPAALHAADILDRLERQGNLTFRQVFEGRTRRIEIIGLFLALLELIRQKQVRIQQETVFGEIYLFRLENQENPPEGDTPSEETMIASNDSVVLDAETASAGRTLLSSAAAALEDSPALETASRFAEAELLKKRREEEPEEEELEEEEGEDEPWEEEEDEDEFGDEDEDDEDLDDDEDEEFEEGEEDDDEDLEPDEEDLDEELEDDELDEDDEEDWEDEEDEDDDEDEDEDEDEEDDDDEDEDEDDR